MKMSCNWWIFPTVIFLFVAFWVGNCAFQKSKSAIIKAGLLLAGIFLAMPSVLATTYYLHILPDFAWYYQFRSLPGSEIAASGAGFLAGVLLNTIKVKRLYTGTVFLTLLCIWTSIPYLKPIVAPIPESILKATWNQDICLQSTGSTCGPASAATIFKVFGIDLSESQLARECLSYLGGTENWYLARAFRKRGFVVRYRISPSFPRDLHLPAIAGVNIGCGHFIPIIAETETTYVTGDPVVGKREYLKAELATAYHFTGFYMEIEKRD